MELLTLVLVWPLLLLAIGVVFVSAADTAGFVVFFPVFVLFIILAFGLTGRLGDDTKDLDHVRRGSVAFSIALLLPIFMKYFLATTGYDLATMIVGLAVGFGALVWGMFLKDNKVLSYANVLGGVFVIVYLYFQLGMLGQLAQVIAAAFGLVVAVIISVFKFREKLT